jgi:hypothetical protein
MPCSQLPVLLNPVAGQMPTVFAYLLTTVPINNIDILGLQAFRGPANVFQQAQVRQFVQYLWQR